MEWYYTSEGLRVGPVSADEFARLVTAGDVQADTLVWRPGMAAWQPCSEVAATMGLPTPRTTPGTETVDATDEATKERTESVLAGPRVYGGFWARAMAKIVDAAITMVLCLGLDFVLEAAIWGGKVPVMDDLDAFLRYQGTLLLWNVVLAIVYQVVFIRRYAATPGKLLLGLELIRADGSALTTGRIIGRYFAESISGLLLGIGFLLAAVDEEHRTLHDTLVDTRVIRRRRNRS